MFKICDVLRKIYYVLMNFVTKTVKLLPFKDLEFAKL